MARHKFTDRWIHRGIKLPPAGERREYFDINKPGFGIRVSGPSSRYPTGYRVWIVVYRRPNGNRVRMELGRVSNENSLAVARKKADQFLVEASGGGDPIRSRDQAKGEKKRQHKNTFSAVFNLYLEDPKVRARRSYAEVKRVIEKHVKPTLGDRPIHTLTRSDLRELAGAIAARSGPVMADRTLSEVRTMFNWHATEDDSFRCPSFAKLSYADHDERARTRTLSDAEIRTLWVALGSTPTNFGDLLKLCLLLGQRKSEIAGMRDSEIRGNVWIIPAARYKTSFKVKLDHVVPLPREALDIIDRQKRLDGSDLVFPGVRGTPFQNWGRAKEDLDSRCEINHWVIHDLRRTARSLMSRSGVQSEIAERVLGHRPPRIVRTYDRWEYLEEKRTSLEKLAGLIDLILHPPAENVVVLHG